jgi:phosphate:Na+ symporter
MAFNGMVGYEMAAGFVLGANLGTTTDVALASIGARTDTKRSALVHILFNAIGNIWALPLLRPLLALVDLVTPGTVSGAVHDIAVMTHIAMLHTIYNLVNTVIFLPFVHQFAKLVSFMVRENKDEQVAAHYKFEYVSGPIAGSPQLNILRAEKEIRDMAGIVSSMYSRFSTALKGLRETDVNDRENTVELCAELQKKEEYIDEMRDTLSGFLTECTRMRLNNQSEMRVIHLIRVIGNLEEMSDECYSISRLLEKSVRRNNIFADKEIDDLIPYVGQVEEFLSLLREHINISDSGSLTAEQVTRVRELENSIDKDRKKLQKLSRKRIQAGSDVKTELIFIDLVRRIEKLGDYCFEIAEPYRR